MVCAAPKRNAKIVILQTGFDHVPETYTLLKKMIRGSGAENTVSVKVITDSIPIGSNNRLCKIPEEASDLIPFLHNITQKDQIKTKEVTVKLLGREY